MAKNKGQKQQGGGAKYELFATATRGPDNWVVELRIVKNEGAQAVAGKVVCMDEGKPPSAEFDVPVTGTTYPLDFSERERTARFSVKSIDEGGATLYPHVKADPVKLLAVGGGSEKYELVTTVAKNPDSDNTWTIHLRLWKGGSAQQIGGQVQVFDEEGHGTHKYKVPHAGRVIKLPITPDKARTIRFVVDSVEDGGKTLYPRVATTLLVLEKEEKKDVLDVLKDVLGYAIEAIRSDTPASTTVDGKKGAYWNVSLAVYLKQKDRVAAAVPAKVKIHDGIPRVVDVRDDGTTNVLLPAARNDREVVFSVVGVQLGADYVDIDVVTEKMTLPGVPYEQIPQRLEPDPFDDPISAFWKGLFG